MKDEPELYAAYLYGLERGKALARITNHNARPPGKVRKHTARKRRNYPLWMRKAFGYLTRPLIQHPEPDGA